MTRKAFSACSAATSRWVAGLSLVLTTASGMPLGPVSFRLMPKT
jgi:hypothetical protein